MNTVKAAKPMPDASRDYIWHYASPLGGITLASDGEALTGLWFDGQKYYGQGLKENRTETQMEIFSITAHWLDVYFAGHKPDFTPPLNLNGSAFRQAVWQALLAIPRGETTTYGEIAKTVARQMGFIAMSAQAVGGAVGHNPIGIIVPCHRVLGADGSLTGYAGGIDKKRKLLKLEGVTLHG